MMWRGTILFLATVLCSQAKEAFWIQFKNPRPGDEAVNSLYQRIIKGDDTTIEEHPYAVQIFKDSDLVCGGSLISMRHVLSAAHCFMKGNNAVSPSHFTIIAGSEYFNRGGTEVSVSMIVIHDSYDPSTEDCDIAVVVLSSILIQSDQIKSIDIPKQGYSLPENTSVTFAGWGWTNASAYSPSNILQAVTVPTVNRTICAKHYAEKNLSNGQPSVVTDNMFCAGLLNVGGKDSCQGDSGGPTVFNSTLVGIISWGYNCSYPGFPSVNVKVSVFSTWIKETVARYNGSWRMQGGGSSLLLTAILIAVYQKNS